MIYLQQLAPCCWFRGTPKEGTPAEQRTRRMLGHMYLVGFPLLDDDAWRGVVVSRQGARGPAGHLAKRVWPRGRC